VAFADSRRRPHSGAALPTRITVALGAASRAARRVDISVDDFICNYGYRAASETTPPVGSIVDEKSRKGVKPK
jgi:hypothetical protein